MGEAMKTIQLQLDEQTFERAWRIATLRPRTLEELIQEIISQLGETEAANDPLLGMFAHEPELIDQVIESAMKARSALDVVSVHASAPPWL
jgi:uncharacterized protein YprB with RNaseH-like and TPR domain